MIEAYFFPLACVVAFIVLLILLFKIGGRPGQKTSALAVIGALVCTVALATGSSFVLDEHFQRPSISSASTLAEMSDQSLLSSWMSAETTDTRMSEHYLARELQDRIDRGDLTKEVHDAVIERATQLVLEDFNGRGNSWVWHVRRWALIGALPEEQANQVIGDLLRDHYYVDVTDGASSAQARLGIRNSSAMSAEMRSLQLPGDKVFIDIKVEGMFVDDVFHDRVRLLGKATGTYSGSGYSMSIVRQDGMIENLHYPDGISEFDDVVVRCLATVTLTTSESTDGPNSVVSLLDLETHILPAQRIGLRRPNQVEIPHEVVTGPLAESLVRAVLLGVIATAAVDDSGYRLSVRLNRRGSSDAMAALPFYLNLELDPVVASCHGSGSRPNLMLVPSLDRITPSSVTNWTASGHSSYAFWSQHCTGEVPEKIDVYLRYAPPKDFPRSVFFEPNPVFFGGEILIKDVPVRVRDQSGTTP